MKMKKRNSLPVRGVMEKKKGGQPSIPFGKREGPHQKDLEENCKISLYLGFQQKKGYATSLRMQRTSDWDRGGKTEDEKSIRKPSRMKVLQQSSFYTGRRVGGFGL